MPTVPVTAVVPLKPTVRAKTRLGFDAGTRGRLAAAFAADVIAACRGCGEIDQTVVVGAVPPGVGIDPLADPGRGLNAALRSAAAHIDNSGRVLAIMGDLPCVRAADVADLVVAAEAALVAGDAPGVFVGDTAGTGTTCVYAPVTGFHPAFGRRSRARHRAAGLAELRLDSLSRLRRDVDSLPDLADALRIGAGPNTTAAVAALGLAL